MYIEVQMVVMGHAATVFGVFNFFNRRRGPPNSQKITNETKPETNTQIFRPVAE